MSVSAQRGKRDAYLETLKAARIVVVDDEAHTGPDTALRAHPPKHLKRNHWERKVRAADDEDDDYKAWLDQQLADAQGTPARGKWHRTALVHQPDAAASPLDVLAVVFGEAFTALDPDEWEALDEGELKIFADDALVLFDRDLKRDTTGDELAQRFLEAHPDARVAIFTSKVDIGEEEIADAEKLRQTHPVVVASKQHLPNIDEMPKFMDQLRLTAVARHLLAARQLVLDLADEAHAQALKEVAALELRTLEDVVINTSRAEGIFEADTLIRVLTLEYRHAFRMSFLADDGKVLGELLHHFEAAREGAPPKPVPDAASAGRTRKLMNRERYADGDIINRPGLPLACGDIFKYGDGSLWMLLEQPCDLQLRDNRDSRSDITHVDLVRIDAGNPPGRSYPLPSEASTFGDGHFLALARRMAVPLDVLELCVFRPDGECSWEIGTSEPATVPQTPGLLRRFGVLKDTMSKLGENTERVPAEFLLRAGDITGITEAGTLRWDLRRVERLDESHAASALTAAMEDRSRAGHDRDFEGAQ